MRKSELISKQNNKHTYKQTNKQALYHDSDLYLLDDPLSAVDPHVANQIMQQAILGFLKNGTKKGFLFFVLCLFCFCV